MGMFVNPGNEAFRVALNSKIYVDKTMLLDYTNGVIDTNDCFICNSRPRRFGKSITANMLTAYYSRGCDSSALFAKTAIAKTEAFATNLNQYDVISVDVQWFLTTREEDALVVKRLQREIIEELRAYYPDALTDDIVSLPQALAMINMATQRKFVIIIDEWDVLVREKNAELVTEYIDLLRGLFKGRSATEYLHLAFMTGILPIKRYKTQSALNNFNEFTMISPGELAPFIGFTDQEVQDLCTQYGRSYKEVKRWYDGYVLGDYQVYNPQVVVSVMQRGEFQSYWSMTGTYESIRPLLNYDFDGLKQCALTMLAGNSVRVNVQGYQNDLVSFKDKDDVLTSLIHLGYLAYNLKLKTVTIPNEEIRGEFVEAVAQNKWQEMLNFERQSDELLQATVLLDCEKVATAIADIHANYASAIKYNDENSLSSVLMLAYLATLQYYFKPVREMPAGKGFADIVYVPRPEYVGVVPALVMELKWNKNVVAAIKQIKAKQYPQALAEYTGDILLVGITYDRNTKKHSCEIEQWVE